MIKKFEKTLKNNFKSAVIMIVLTGFILISYSIIVFFYKDFSLKQSLINKAEAFVQLGELAILEPLWDYDEETIQFISKAFFKDNEFVFIEVKNPNGSLIFKENRIENDQDKNNIIFKEKTIYKDGITERGYVLNNQPIGIINIGLTKQYRQEQLKNELYISFILIIITLCLLYIVIKTLFKQEKKNKKNVELILNNMSDSVITVNQDFIITSCNKSTEKLFGYPSNEILGNKIDVLIKNPDKIYAREQLSENSYKIKISPDYKADIYGLRKDLSEFPIEINVEQIVLEDKPLYLLEIRDITQRNEVNKLKSEFVSIVSHELRTPLTSIIGGIKLVINGCCGAISDDTKKILKIAEKNSDSLLKLIDDILDIEKLEKGKIKFDIEPVEAISFIKNVLENNKIYAEQYGVSYKFTSEIEEIKILADKDRLSQVLNNLLSNAVKFSRKNEEVVISVKKFNNMLRVLISDKGIGIPESAKASIFEKFTQADPALTRRKGGTGLGLSICKNLIIKMNGNINFYSEENKGSTFYFDLPIYDS